MLKEISPKLPMRNKAITRNFYVNVLRFVEWGDADFPQYLMVRCDNIEIHFFEFSTLDPNENYGQVYIRTDDIDSLYKSLVEGNVGIHPNGNLQVKSWGQKEFSLLDPDNNLLTFGQSFS